MAKTKTIGFKASVFMADVEKATQFKGNRGIRDLARQFADAMVSDDPSWTSTQRFDVVGFLMDFINVDACEKQYWGYSDVL